MADEDRDTPLPRRVRGATRAGTSTSPPAISEELRHRMQAAVTAERSAAAARVHAGEQQSSAGGEVTTPAVESPVEDASARGAVNGAAALPARITQPERTGQAGRADGAGSFAEDEVTEWLGTSAGTRPAAKRGSGGAVQPWPTTDRPADREPAAPSKARLAVLAAAGLMIGSLAVLAVRHFTGSPGNAQASAAMTRQDAEARDQAAAWVVQQVSPSAIVSCDLVMCNALTAYGFPSRDLLVLGPTSPDPVTSGVVVETEAVQSTFGSSLATAWAPAVLASFGSGQAAITVRVIAPHGAAAYQTALRADLNDRKSAGAALLKDPQITVSVLAAEQLTAGLVDSRLLVALAALAGHQPISVVQFGSTGPGASAGVPLGFVDLAENDAGAHLASAAYVRSLRAYLSTVNYGFRPAAMVTVVLADGQAVMRVEVSAPSPLGTSRASDSS